MKQRLLNFDIAKALCIILVVIGHYGDNAPDWWMGMNDVMHSFRMPLFMFASGYIYIAFKKEEGYCKFLGKKVKRLMVPYLAVSAIIITIKLLTQGNAYVENPATVMSYLKALYSPEAGYFLWFMWALWWMFVVVPFFKTKSSRLALFGLSIVLHFMPSFLPMEYFCFMEFQNMLMYFMIGVCCWDWKEIIPNKLHWSTGLVGFAGVTALSKLEVFADCNSYFSCIVSLLGIMMVMQLSTLIVDNKDKKALSGVMYLLTIVSASSFIIYLFHTTFMGFAKAELHKVPALMDDDNALMYSAGALIVVTCGVICPIVLHRYVLNRWDVTKVMFGLR